MTQAQVPVFDKRVYEGHISFHPLRNVPTLLPDNTIMNNDEEVIFGANSYFLDLKDRIMYRIKKGKRYRIKHQKEIIDTVTGRSYSQKLDGWKIIIPEYKKEIKEPEVQVKEPVPAPVSTTVTPVQGVTFTLPNCMGPRQSIFGKSLLTMYYANESIYHKITDMKELVEVKEPERFTVIPENNQLKISYKVESKERLETLIMFQAGQPVPLLSFARKSTVMIPITYLDQNDQKKTEVLLVELVPIYDREITVKLSIDPEQIKDGLVDIKDQLMNEIEWLNPCPEFFPINHEDGFEFGSDSVCPMVKLAPEERVYGEIVQRRLLGLTGTDEAQRIFNLILHLPQKNSPYIMRYAQREQRIPVPHGEEIRFYNAVTGELFDPSKRDIEVFKKNDLIEWINVGTDYSARTVSFELVVIDSNTGLKETYIYNLLLTN